MDYPYFRSLSLTMTLILYVLCSTLQAQADLSLSGGLEPGDDNINSGDRVSVDFTVFNSGDDDAEDPRVAFYLSTDATYSSNDVFLESEELSDIDEGESEDEGEQFSVYASQAGSYYIIAYIDYRDFIPETNENNNQLAMPITINGSSTRNSGTGSNTGVDLRLTATMDPANDTTTAGEEVDVSYDVYNDGQDDAGEFRVAFYLSLDATWDNADLYLEKDTHDDLESGDNDDDDEEVRIPSNQTPGDYYLLVYADDLDSLNDSDPSNNLIALPITITSSNTISTRSISPSTPELQVFPNPVGNLIQLELIGERPQYLSIVNLQGHVVYQQPYTASRASIDASDWPTGSYIVRVQTEQQVYHKRIIKK